MSAASVLSRSAAAQGSKRTLSTVAMMLSGKVVLSVIVVCVSITVRSAP